MSNDVSFEDVVGYDPRRFVHYNPIEVGYLLNRLVDSMWADRVDSWIDGMVDAAGQYPREHYAHLKDNPIDPRIKDRIVDELFSRAHELVEDAVNEVGNKNSQ